MPPSGVGPDPGVVKALSHPLRMRLLGRFNEEVLSPAELAREFGVSLPLVSYHVKVLRDNDCLELVRETKVRGAIEHHYRATRRALYSEAEWAALDLDAKQALTGAVLQDAVTDALEALQAGRMDARSDRHVSYTTLDLDERGWQELNRRLEEVVEEGLRLQAETAGRRAGGDGHESITTRLTVLHYESVPDLSMSGTQPPARRERAKRGKR